MVYVGDLVAIHKNKIKIKFGDNFCKSFGGGRYSIDLYPSRKQFVERHKAIDEAFQMFGPNFFFPFTQNEVGGNVQLDVDLISDDILTLDGKEIEWFNKNLNVEQKRAIKTALRGEVRPLPFLIYGPPGKHIPQSQTIST